MGPRMLPGWMPSQDTATGPLRRPSRRPSDYMWGRLGAVWGPIWPMNTPRGRKMRSTGRNRTPRMPARGPGFHPGGRGTPTVSFIFWPRFGACCCLLARRAGSSHWPKMCINRHQLLRNFSSVTLTPCEQVTIEILQDPLTRKAAMDPRVQEAVLPEVPPPAPFPFARPPDIRKKVSHPRSGAR